MKILFVHSGSDLYGASRSQLRLATRLVRDGHDVIVIIPQDGPLVENLLRAHVTAIVDGTLSVITRRRTDGFRGTVSLLAGLPRSVYRLLKHLRMVKPDVVHTNTAVVLSSGIAARLAGIPHIWHIRESFAEFGWKWRLYQWYIWLCATRIVCVSSAVREQFTKRIRSSRVDVIHNGVPRNEIEMPDLGRVQEFRRRFGLEGRKVVGVVGRIKYLRKGQETFVCSAALLKDRFPDVRFLIIGSPYPGNEGHLVELQRLACDLGIGDQLIFTGDMSDMATVYSVLDISVLPSGQPEPFGGVVIESMAYAKPVVGTNVGGTPEQVEEGETGFLVEPGDASAMANAIGRLLSDGDLRLKCGQKARLRFYLCFEFELFYCKMMRLYRAVKSDRK